MSMVLHSTRVPGMIGGGLLDEFCLCRVEFVDQGLGDFFYGNSAVFWVTQFGLSCHVTTIDDTLEQYSLR